MNAPASSEAAGHRPQRLPALDLLRFVAALMVLLFHYGFRGAIDGAYLDTGYPLLGEWARYGYLGVDLFFVISGFVILLTVDAGKGVPSHFVASRISRLYPVFWAALVLTFLVVWGRPEPFGVGLKDFVLNLGMVPSWLGARYVDGVYWTLEVELKFYLMVTAYLLFLQRFLQIEWVLALWLSVLLLLAPHDAGPYLVRQWVLADAGAFFVAGCLFYRAYRQGWTWLRSGLLALSWACASIVTWKGAVALTELYGQVVSPPVAVALITALFALVGLLCWRPGLFSIGGRLGIVLGALTYPLYLVHQKMGYLSINALAPRVGPEMALVTTIIGMLVLAWLLHRLVERPFNGRFRRWLEPRLRFMDRPRLLPQAPAPAPAQCTTLAGQPGVEPPQSAPVGDR